MKKVLAAALLGLLVLAPLAAPAAARAEISSRKEIRVAPGETQEEIVSFGGHVLIEGKVKGDVVVFGGSITISGEVGQSVVGVGSRIQVKSTASVAKDLAALGGTLEKEPGCAIGGDTIYFQTREIGDRLFREGHVFDGVFSLSIIPIIVAAKLVMIVLWLIIALMGAGLLPRQIAYAGGEIRKRFWPDLGIGLLAIIVFLMVMFFAGMLCFILVGIPIAMALGVGGFIIWVFGRLAVLYFLGESALRGFRSTNITAMSAVLMGLLVFSLAGFVPVLGLLFTLAMNAVGWGVALRTKFGTRENWFVKKPA
ncbi:MAG: hypothetical protein ABFD52_12565 [Acidobacteriota bacterium]